jgi:hypothetical protein
MHFIERDGRRYVNRDGRLIEVDVVDAGVKPKPTRSKNHFVKIPHEW